MSWSTGYDFYWGGIAINGDKLYAGTNQTITQTDLNTGTIINTSWATGFNQLGYVIVYNNFLYAADISTITTPSTIYKIDTTIPNPVPQVFFNTSLNNPVGLVVNGGYLYVANSGADSISKISMSDPNGDNNVNWVQNSLITNPVGLYINNNVMYVTSTGSSGGGNTICTINMTTLAVNVVVVSNDVILGIVGDGTNIYAADLNNGNIQQLDLNGNVINSAWANVSPNSDGLCINGSDLYASNDGTGGAGVIYKFSLNGSPPQQSVACFKEGTKILTDNGYKPIQDLRKGDLVRTLNHGYKPINMIGKREMQHSASKSYRIKNQLYTCSSKEYPQIFEDLVITGCHCILVDDFKDEQQKEKTREVNGNIYITDNKYRVPACIDERTSVYKSPGNYTIYHIALDNDNYYMNYGIFANGLLVESCSKRYLKELSNMVLIN
jgi:hypothetical protein